MIIKGVGQVLLKTSTEGHRIYRQSVKRGSYSLWKVDYRRKCGPVILSCAFPAFNGNELCIQGSDYYQDNKVIDIPYDCLSGVFNALIFEANRDAKVSHTLL